MGRVRCVRVAAGRRLSNRRACQEVALLTRQILAARPPPPSPEHRHQPTHPPCRQQALTADARSMTRQISTVRIALVVCPPSTPPPPHTRTTHSQAHRHGSVHEPADLGGVRLAERPAKDREVLGEGKHGAAVHAAATRHDAVACMQAEWADRLGAGRWMQQQAHARGSGRAACPRDLSWCGGQRQQHVGSSSPPAQPKPSAT
jgi:hypothetical protein